jgi:hypothetical protein
MTVTFCPLRAKFNSALSEYSSHIALLHYSGGRPVPRAAFLSRRQEHIPMLSSICPLGNYPSFGLLSFSNNQTVGLKLSSSSRGSG